MALPAAVPVPMPASTRYPEITGCAFLGSVMAVGLPLLSRAEMLPLPMSSSASLGGMAPPALQPPAMVFLAQPWNATLEMWMFTAAPLAGPNVPSYERRTWSARS